MATNYINLEDYGLEFKHIISGPAPVGRILNYLILIGRGILKHKNGNRDLHLTHNIGSAWCTEFMVGLGLAYYNDIGLKDSMPMALTADGEKLFSFIKDYPHKFDESSNCETCKGELKSFSKDAYECFEDIFKRSVVCKNLCAYLINSGVQVFPKATFYDEYFGFFTKYYTGKEYIFDPTSSAATTGNNRVPSLVQLCEFFDMVYTDDRKMFVFDLNKIITKDDASVSYVDVKTLIEELKKEDEHNLIIAKDLEEKYGIDGTVTNEIVSRNSQVQAIFRNNLFAKYGCKCALCDKDISEVLVASHIKPAAKSNVYEKADYENGLLLCANHDKLFDQHLISFDFNTGKLLFRKNLEDKLQDYDLNPGFVLDEKYMTDKRKQYLMQHNVEFFAKNKEQ